jgi:hypothetical protein
LPMWLVGALFAIFVVICIAALRRSGFFRVIGALICIAVVATGGLAAWNVLDRLAVRERAEARRELDRRAMDLNQQAMAPGSALACLDGTLGEQIEAVCEKALFASAESAAAAVSYAHAKFVLYLDSIDQSNRDPDYETKAASLRIPLETDRYGVVAQMLVLRYGCTAARCDAVSVFRSANRLQANLKDRPFDTFVARNAANWTTSAKTAATPQAGPATAIASAPSAPAPVTGSRDFPSAASIPPVSIMNAEPSATSPPSAPAATASTPVPPRRPAPSRWSGQPAPPRAAVPSPSSVPPPPPSADNGQSVR